MKKALLGLGTLATIAAPVAAVVSCGSSNDGGPSTTPGVSGTGGNTNPGGTNGGGSNTQTSTATTGSIPSVGSLVVPNIKPTASTIQGATNPPAGITSITSGVYSGKNVDPSFVIPASVTSIEAQAFAGSTLPSGFTIPTTVLNIAQSAFIRAKLPIGHYWSKVDNIGYPDIGAVVTPLAPDFLVGKTQITTGQFKGANLPVGFVIPPSIQSIGRSAFVQASAQLGFTIPARFAAANPTSITPFDIVVVGNPFDMMNFPPGAHWDKTFNGHDPKAGAKVVL